MIEKMTEKQREYERKRAERANMSLEAWLKEKEARRRADEEAAEAQKKLRKPTKPSALRRLIDRAHKPL